MIIKTRTLLTFFSFFVSMMTAFSVTQRSKVGFNGQRLGDFKEGGYGSCEGKAMKGGSQERALSANHEDEEKEEEPCFSNSDEGDNDELKEDGELPKERESFDGVSFSVIRNPLGEGNDSKIDQQNISKDVLTSRGSNGVKIFHNDLSQVAAQPASGACEPLENLDSIHRLKIIGKTLADVKKWHNQEVGIGYDKEQKIYLASATKITLFPDRYVAGTTCHKANSLQGNAVDQIAKELGSDRAAAFKRSVFLRRCTGLAVTPSLIKRFTDDFEKKRIQKEDNRHSAENNHDTFLSRLTRCFTSVRTRPQYQVIPSSDFPAPALNEERQQNREKNKQ